MNFLSFSFHHKLKRLNLNCRRNNDKKRNSHCQKLVAVLFHILLLFSISNFFFISDGFFNFVGAVRCFIFVVVDCCQCLLFPIVIRRTDSSLIYFWTSIRSACTERKNNKKREKKTKIPKKNPKSIKTVEAKNKSQVKSKEAMQSDKNNRISQRRSILTNFRSIQ